MLVVSISTGHDDELVVGDTRVHGPDLRGARDNHAATGGQQGQRSRLRIWCRNSIVDVLDGLVRDVRDSTVELAVWYSMIVDDVGRARSLAVIGVVRRRGRDDGREARELR